ncbi:hypothetical protein BELL_0645g00030 [Botrytis elliptica]|uniref:Uncharacterized protein n=1 Tax=Botrytis elliptica TaxID=278938 RepID=A0A4Z1JB79_9HELO|nr:hypothetical protein EAE99_010564 [Botrytis elliptica]TGO70929.1 hypothetical protein BELL_0645g00030 [Botrytis elliptica]
MSCCNIFNCLPSSSKVLRKSSGKAKLSNSSDMRNDDNLAYGTMDTDHPQTGTATNERTERPKNDRRKTTYTFPIKIMPSPKSATTASANLTPEFTEFDTQAYYNESLDYNYISSRFAFSLGLKPDADREAKPRSKSVSKPKIPFKPKHLARSQTAPVAEIKPLQRSRTEPLSRRIFSPLGRESTIEDTPLSTSTTPALPPRIPPRRTSTTATLVPSNAQAPPIFSLLEPTPEAISRSNLTSPLFPDANLNPFSPRPGATFGAMVVDTPPRTPQRPQILHTQTEGNPSIFEALNSHPVTPSITNIPTILTEEPEGMSEEPEDASSETERERDLEGMGTGTGIGMGFGIGEEIRGREISDPDSMTGDLTLHWKSSPLSRYTQRTVFWIVPNAKFDLVFGHDETDFNIPIQNPPKWGLSNWGIGQGRGRRGERNQFREGIRRGVLKQVEEQSTFSLLYSATNLMDAWLRPPYQINGRAHSQHSDSKPLLSNGDESGGIHEIAFTLPELEYQLRNELKCTDERRRKHEGKRAVNIWDVRAGKAVLAEQAKGASGEIRKLVGAVVKDVRENGGKKIAESKNKTLVGRAPREEPEVEAAHDKFVHVENPVSATPAPVVSNEDFTVVSKPQVESSPATSPLLPVVAPLPNPQTFDLFPTTANDTANQSPSSSLRVEFTDAQLQAQIQAQMEREMEREMEQEMEREMQAQIEAEMNAQAQAQPQSPSHEEVRDEVRDLPPALPPRPKRFERSSTFDFGSVDAKDEQPRRLARSSTFDSPASFTALRKSDRDIHASISALRSAHNDDEDDEENEAMSEIMVSRIPVRELVLEEEEVEFSVLPDRSFGTLKERFEMMWQGEDERVHSERKIWRGKFRGVLGELCRVVAEK